MIENGKVVTVIYDLYIAGDEPQTEDLMEQATEENPLIYCHGERMMLPEWERQMAGKEIGDSFDFTIGVKDAYGERDESGVLELSREMFVIDGKFDDERVQVGNVIPMNTTDGQIVNAMVLEITDETVTIDLNHPLAGEDLHFKGKVLDIRDVTEGELKAIRGEGCHCHGNCGECDSDCGGNCQCEKN